MVLLTLLALLALQALQAPRSSRSRCTGVAAACAAAAAAPAGEGSRQLLRSSGPQLVADEERAGECGGAVAAAAGAAREMVVTLWRWYMWRGRTVGGAAAAVQRSAAHSG